MNKQLEKLLVIVPYRDREKHLQIFIPYIIQTLQQQNIDYNIVVVEQSYGKLFNRGLLCNIGFQLFSKDFEYICIHDIDIIGKDFDYRYEPVITHISARPKNKNYKEWYEKCIGGVVLFPTQDFIKINGFSNEYWGWGCEDDDLRIRCDLMKIAIQRKKCKYEHLEQKESPENYSKQERINNVPGYAKNLERLNNFKEIKDKNILLHSGINNSMQYCLEYNIINNDQYTLIKCNI